MKNLKKVAAVIALIITMVLAIGYLAFVRADSTKTYLLDVVNARGEETDIEENEDIIVSQKILKDNDDEPFYDDRELTLQLDITSKKEWKNPEIAMIFDTSYSVTANDPDNLLKTSAADLAGAIYDNCSGATITLYNAQEAITSRLSASSKSTIISKINSMGMNVGSNIADAITVARSSFSSDDTNKFVILFTDGTDYISTELADLVADDIKVITVSKDNVINNSYYDGSELIGYTQMVYSSTIEDEDKLFTSFNKSAICDIFNNSINSISLNEKFSNVIKDYLEISYINGNGSATAGIDGFTWNCDSIPAGSTKTLVFKLKIKEGINITDPSYLYHDLVVGDNFDISYIPDMYSSPSEIKSFEFGSDHMPIIKICDKYSVTLKAVSEENKDILIPGIKFNVLAKDSNGKVVYRQNDMISDVSGNVVIDNLKTTGTVHFIIKPVVDVVGYDDTDTIEFDITNNFGTNFTVDTPEWAENASINNSTRNISIIIPINTQKFAMEINLTELYNSGVTLSDVDFRLIQPKLNDRYEMKAIYGTTGADGKVIIYPTAIPKEGKYEYILSQMTTVTGYKSIGNATIRITFDDNGLVVVDGIEKEYNDNVDVARISPNYVVVNVGNKALMDDAFDFEINLFDEEDTSIKLDDAEYEIENVTYGITQRKITSGGNIKISTPGSGYVQLKVTQLEAKTGYVKDEEPKNIVIYRTGGSVQSVVQAYNMTSLNPVDAFAYSVDNKVVVNLYNKKRLDRNLLKVRLSDSEENDIFIPGVELKLKNKLNNKEYTGTTDIDGIASFHVDNEPTGVYPYSIEVVSGLSVIYKNLEIAEISLQFNEDGDLAIIGNIWSGASTKVDPVLSLEGINVYPEGIYTNYEGIANLGAILKEEYKSKLEINLVDKDDPSISLEGAKYNINIQSTVASGQSFVRDLKNRETDVNGKIETSLVNADKIIVRISQKQAAREYKRNEATKEIELRYVDGVLSLVDSDITDVVLDGNKVIVTDYSRKTNKDDIYLDFTIIKQDMSGGLIAGLPVRIYSEAYSDLTGSSTTVGDEIGQADGFLSDGVKYGSWIETCGDPHSPVPLSNSDHVYIETTTDANGTIVLKGLPVRRVSEVSEPRFILYVVEYDPVTGIEKENSKVKFIFEYWYNPSKEYFEGKRVETTLGNSLIIDKSKEFNGDMTDIGYESYVIATLRGNNDDIGNLSIDLFKLNDKEDRLDGAKYIVKTVRPDGSFINNKVDIDNDYVELPGVFANVGTQIEITEDVAPLGYSKDPYTKVLTVENITETGEIELSISGGDSTLNRAVLEKVRTYVTDSGTLKNEYRLKLIDYELNTFDIKVNTINALTGESVGSYQYEVTSSKGAQKNTRNLFDAQEVVVGSNYKDEVLNYYLTNNNVPLYYKPHEDFKLNVAFDSETKVDSSTLDLQTDPLYGNPSAGGTWEIAGINVNKTQEEKNATVEMDVSPKDIFDVVLNVYVYPEEPLEVEVETIDTVSGDKVTGVSYKITPSVNLDGIGVFNPTTENVDVQVGYALKDSTSMYTLTTTVPNNYINVDDQEFVIGYDSNSNINSHVISSYSHLNLVVTGDKSIKLTNYVTPKQGIQILNSDYYTGDRIGNSKFEITTENGTVINADVDLTGITSILGSAHGEANSNVRYKIHQKTHAEGYVSVDDFDIIVYYGSNREIVNVTLDNCTEPDLIDVSAICPSSSTDLGYNGNSKGIVKIEIKNIYDFRVNIENIDRFDNTVKIQGGNYSVTSTLGASGTVTTQADGVGTAHLDEKKNTLAAGVPVIYTITETSPSRDYQSLESAIEVEVMFDTNGYVIPSSVKVISGHGDDYANAYGISVIANATDRFTINVKITNVPKIRFQIHNVDFYKSVTDNSRNLVGAEFKCDPESGDGIENVTTDDLGEAILRVNTCQRGTPFVYEISQAKAAYGYQRMEENIKIEVQFNADGSIGSCALLQGNRFASATVDTVTSTTGSFAVNLEIKSSPLVNINIDNINTTVDDSGAVTVNKIKNVEYKVTAFEYDSNTDLNFSNSGVTDVNGQTTIPMDRALSNKNIKYVIHQVTKSVDYERIECDIIIKLHIKNNGKIQSGSWSIISDDSGASAAGFATIKSVDVDNFNVNIEIENNPIKEFGVHLRAVDMYSDEPIDGVVANTYLTQNLSDSVLYVSDHEYDIEKVNEEKTYSDDRYKYLCTGADRDGNGYSDVAIGEDFQLLGKYTEKDRSRVLRIVLKDVPAGYQWYTGSVRATQSYHILIRVNFDEDGRVVSTQLLTGVIDGFGCLADGRYVSAEPSGYGVAVRLKFYKTLNTRLEAQDMYTGDILEGRMTLSTSRYLDEETFSDWITEGYIGNNSHASGNVYRKSQSHDYVPTARTERSKKRIFRLYEESAPIEGYYQQYRPTVMDKYFQRKLAEITVEYDENGCIENAYVSNYVSANNIHNGYIDLEWSGCNLSIRVKYAPTTKIVTTVVDRVTGTPLSDISINPFATQRAYFQSDLFNSDIRTNAAGRCSKIYWGANVAESGRNYKLSVSFPDSKFDGYYLPGQINIDVLYNNIGRIGSVKVLSNNTFGDAPNAEWTAEDNVVYLTIKLDRKFKIKLNKQDIYDSSEKLNVKFNIESSKHETKEFNSGSTTAIGRIHPGADVVYTLSEVGGIDGYIPLTNIKMYVHFNTDGTIGDVHVERGYEKYFEIQSTASVEAGIRGVNTVDLEFVVKNIPRFNASIKLTDAFYSTVGLTGGNFTLTSDKGESASGALVTDENGNAATSIGEVHPNETVVYTLTQTNTISGYRSNSASMVFSVKYNEKGNIDSYTVLSENSMLYIKPSIYNGTKSMVLEVSNEPKDVNIGIVNLDYDTEEGINDINYEVQITDIDTGVTDVKNYITQSNLDGDGTVSGVVDNVEKSVEKRRVNYKVIEKNVPATYRKIKDMDFTIIYNEDGSIESYVINSNESNADIEIFAKDTAIKKLNGILAHIKITIKNDNRYDLIINDFDKNYTSLGVKGTKYKVLIDGATKTVPATNDLGQTLLSRNEGSGTINLDVAEDEIGNGYRADLSNLVNIVLDKGTGVYSLKLNPSTPGYINDQSASDGNVTISVDEEAGLVYVTFLNETKYEFDVNKYDMKSGASLSDVVFEIKSYELDNDGDKVLPSEKLVTTTGVDDTTDSEGYLHFDLGTTPQNKKMVYVFDEVVKPDGYEDINQFEVYVDFDITGQLVNKGDNSPNVETAVNPNNKNGIVVLVGNKIPEEPTIDPDTEDPLPKYLTYNIKVVSRDSVTKKRINGSKFNIDIRHNDGTQLQAMDGQLTGDFSIGSLVVEKGVVISNDLKAENTVTVDVDQIGLATGYEFTSQTSGTVELQVDYILDSDGFNKKPNISLVNDDGLDVEIDNSNRVVTIVVENNPGVTLDIYNCYEETSYDVESSSYISTVNPLQNSKFRITSYVRTKSSTSLTGLNKAFPMTDDAGNTSVGIGCPVAGKEVVYTITQDPILGFENIGDIVLAVKYDSSGNIKAVNVESDLDVTKVVEGSINGKKFGIEVKNQKERYLDPYNIVLEKHSIHDGEYDYLIPNATFQITVKEEYGVERSWFDTTNEDGIITGPEFNGYGRIKVVYTEITAPDGFQLDNKTHQIEFIRDRQSGIFTLIGTDENFAFDETAKKTVYVKPQDELQKGRYDFIINIVSEDTKERIHSNTSTFEVYLVKDGVDELLGTVTTEDDGRAVLSALKAPEEEGEYRFKIKQIIPPDGYIKVQDEYNLDVTFSSSLGYNEISYVCNPDTAYFDLLETKSTLVAVNVRNKDDGILGGIKLSISDVDKNTGNLIIGRPALFELTDDDGTTQYDLNYETGLLEISGLPIPDVSEFGIKDDGTDVTEIVHNYKLKQIAQPYGYFLNTNEYDINIKFVIDPADGKVIIDSVTVTTGTDTVISTITDNVIEFTVENEEAEYGYGSENFGTYSLNIKKLDEITSEPITDRTTFEVMLENGQAFTASTDENGNILIKDIKVPSTVNTNLGPYAYVIEETKAADGYTISDRYTIIDITFKEKERTDPDEEITYVIDTVEKLMGDQAVITSYDESEVNITIYNKLDGFDIIYDQNSDDTTISNIPANQYKLNGEDIVLSDMVPERDGYIFKGWSTTPTGTVDYNPGDTYTTDAELNLYAVWEEKLYLKSTKYFIGERPEVYELNAETGEGPETEYKDGDEYIGNIIPYVEHNIENYPGTTVATLRSNLITNADKIIVSNGELVVDTSGESVLYELGDDELVGTNMIIKLIKGNQTPIELRAVVVGDIKNKNKKNYGDGTLTAIDTNELVSIAKEETSHNITDRKHNPVGAFRLACDVSREFGIISGIDVSRMPLVISGQRSGGVRYKFEMYTND